VNVSADWEVAGTWLVSSVVALLLVVAAFRLIRRRRRNQDAESSTDAAGRDQAESQNV
jgi:flagellar biosynthesis/type III secretory pathway M-ring protein FliF/YscJ